MPLTDLTTPQVRRYELDRLFRDSYTPLRLIRLFETDLGPAFERSAGVGQGYTLAEHTLMVLCIFEYYFAWRPMPAQIDRDLFRVILLLHDIGKPAAIAREGKGAQHRYNREIALRVLSALGFCKAETGLADALVSHDPLGPLFRAGHVDGPARAIREAAAKAGLARLSMLDVFSVMFRCDAGSYTVHGGGKPGLDRLFVFDPTERRLDFAHGPRTKLHDLSAHLCADRDGG